METTYSCKKACGASFNRNDNRDRHEKRKSGCKGTKEIEIENNVEVAAKPEFACTKRWCKKVFKSKFNKDRHEETYDKSNKIYVLFVSKFLKDKLTSGVIWKPTLSLNNN